MVLLPKPIYLQDPAVQEVFVRLVNEHRGMLHKVCRLYCFTEPDRQDLFQEIVVQLWKSYPGFRGDSRFGTWLYRIALNTAISGWRKQQRRIQVSAGDDPAKHAGALPVEWQEIRYSDETEERLHQLYSAIDQLTEVEKALTMLYLEDKSYQEMEEILGLTQNNLRVKMNRIKEKLRKITKEGNHGAG